MADDSALLRLAHAIVDAAAPDWAAAESTADTADDLQIIRELKIVADLAALHRGSPAPPADVVNLNVPSQWGPLLLRAKIGQGHFGTVYLAWDAALERPVALKLLRESARSEEIIREGRLLARVRHPNVVTVHGVDRHDGVVGLWMEFVDGLTLARVLATRGRLASAEAALVGVDLCRAVAAVHEAGLVHRDIKAQNVMREGTGRIVVMDFGAGEIRTGRSGMAHAAGTPLYLAPELFDGAPATIASDIYSIGVLLFYLLTMRYPVEGATVEEIAAAHAAGERQRLSQLCPAVPVSVSKIVERALERDPARRYRSCEEMHPDLMDAAQQAGRQSPAPAVTRSAHTASVAVLPFASLGPDRDLEYFSNGLADDLLTALGKVPGLRLVSRASAAHAARGDADVRRICGQLGVDAALEGTLRKVGDRVRITARLVNAGDGSQLWSEGYDRPLSDVFAAVDEIARSIVDRLMAVAPVAIARRPLVDRHSRNPRAYEHYLKGRFYWTRRYHGGLLTAIDHFNKAIEEDAGYALAYAGLADAYSFIGIYAVQKPRLALARAIAAAERALALDPDLPEAHTALAFIKMGNAWDLPGAAHEFTRALDLDPRQAVARIYYSWLLVLQGDIASARVQVRAAQKHDPLSPLVNAGAGHTFFLARRYDEAIVECEKSLEIDPNFILGTHVLGMCRALQGRVDDAIERGERAAAMAGRAPFYLGVLGHYYARRGAPEQVQAILDELEQIAATRYVPPHCQVFIFAALGDFERAFEWQAKAYDDGAPPFYYVSPLIANLHDDPRHREMMRKMGWPY